MPIEIKELHIKAVVAPRRETPSGFKAHKAENDYEKIRRELVEECVEKILQFLNDKKER